jgi:membrane fusion protein, multidrug efflux system
LLFTIDPRPYQHQVGQVQGNIAKDQALLKQAEANLARDKAQDEFTRAQSGRYDSLTQKGLIARDSAEQIKAQAGASQESIRADEAAIESAHANINGDLNALESAKLQLSYCTIYAPIDGRTGAVMLKAGNLVKAADVPMVVINQLNPIYVNFTVPQQYWADIKKHMADGSLHVTAAVPQDAGEPKQGSVTFVDNTVDATTGTIHIRATFENSDNRLLPGLFINVTLRLSEELNATVIPLQAITEGQNGTFVYVVKSDNTVEMRTVVSSRSRGGEAVIDKGLQPGEIVVTDGQTRLAPNAKVEIKNNLNEAVAP